MGLTVSLATPAALFRKMEREAYRAYHATSPLHAADHFYNFCITAASMRDYMREASGTASGRGPYDADWDEVSELVAAVEIANSSKHFSLRQKDGKAKQPRTRAVRRKASFRVPLYANASGELKIGDPERWTEISVTLEGGKALELHQFTESLLRYWKQYLLDHGFKVRRQSFRRLAGGPDHLVFRRKGSASATSAG